MRVLILSRTAWDNGNSFGNTFTNLFSNIDDIEIANIYTGSGKPNNTVVSKYYQITEKMLISNIRNKNNLAGKEVFYEESKQYEDTFNENAMNFAKKKRWQILFWIRDFIWKIGRWKTDELLKFVDDFKPDIIYTPIYYSKYMCNLNLFFKEYLNIPMVGHVTDDVYTMKCLRFSPLFWIDRIMIRTKVKKLVMKCEYIDTFTDIQKNEYEKIFNKPFHILYKSADFSGNVPEYRQDNVPLKLVFTGNISSGRWRSLLLIANGLKEINKEEIKAQLVIYTATPMSLKMKKALNIQDSVLLIGSVPANQIKEIQEDADFLVHVESFALKDKLQVRMSFSTKIVDYLTRGKCILAIGPSDVASIDYFIKNDCGVSITNRKEMIDKLELIIEDNKIREKYGIKAWNCGMQNHNEQIIKKEFQESLKRGFYENTSN